MGSEVMIKVFLGDTGTRSWNEKDPGRMGAEGGVVKLCALDLGPGYCSMASDWAAHLSFVYSSVCMLYFKWNLASC